MVSSSFVDSVSQRETENAGGVLGRSKQARNTARVDAKHTQTQTHTSTHKHTVSLAVIGQHCADIHTYSLERGLDEYREKRREKREEERNGKKREGYRQ